MDKIKEFSRYVTKCNLGEIKEDVSFKKLTSLRIGGICKLLYIPNDIESLSLSLRYLNDNKIRYYVIGNGTNLLVNDIYFEMVLISFNKLKKFELIKENESNYYFYVESGVSTSIVAQVLASRNISGAEFMGVIPGSIGGATYMNAGAYKKSISEIIDSITYFDESGFLQTALNKNDNFKFRYRFSKFKKTKMIIVSLIIKLPKLMYTETPLDKVNRYLNKKRIDQPLNSYNAGSTFKNNFDSYYAWQIIDQLGYRGKNIGDAYVSTKHANFIINNGNAKFIDMITLIQMIKYDAKNKLNIDLEIEWEILQ